MTGTTPNVDTIIQGDCLEEMGKLPDRSIDAIVTDPPYELAFMGKKWDASGIAYNVDMWEECLRVLKPGGHLLAFGGSRTYHRMACAIEDVGFEIRDSIHWVYGSGFPKSLDISKQLDRTAAKTSEDVKKLKDELRRVFDASGLTLKELNSKCGFEASGYLRKSSTWRSVLPTVEKWQAMRNAIGTDEDFSFEFKEIEREVIGQRAFGINSIMGGLEDRQNINNNYDITAPATDLAKQWAGWGSSLKPAHEPVVLARKPLEEATIAANVLRWGCGGLNVDGCRIGFADPIDETESKNKNQHGNFGSGQRNNRIYGEDRNSRTNYNAPGRFPSNLIHDASPEVLAEFAKAGTTKSGAMKKEVPAYEGESTTGFLRGRSGPSNQHGDSGSVARFFQSCSFQEEDIPAFAYYAKAGPSERNGSTHPTMKPLSLMRYLCRLITPPGGLILDPFGGSGTTGIAATKEGFHYILIELSSEYCEIARKRVAAVPARLDRWAEAEG